MAKLKAIAIVVGAACVKGLLISGIYSMYCHHLLQEAILACSKIQLPKNSNILFRSLLHLIRGTMAAARRIARRAFSLAAQAALEVESWQSPTVMTAATTKQVPPGGMIQWLFLGCPGVGKGTYASRLAKLLSVPHIAMGDLVRHELKQSSPLSKELSNLMSQGKLLPDEIIFSLLSKRFDHGSKAGENGFILDGFPRTTSQAKTLENVADINLVVNLKLREDILVTKCLGRRICGQCGKNFNVAEIDVEGEEGNPRIFMPPLLPPPSCASKLTIRVDDTENVVKERLRIYSEESKPVEDYYRARGKILDFEISGGIPETWPRLLAALNLDDKIAAEKAAA